MYNAVGFSVSPCCATTITIGFLVNSKGLCNSSEVTSALKITKWEKGGDVACLPETVRKGRVKARFSRDLNEAGKWDRAIWTKNSPGTGNSARP